MSRHRRPSLGVDFGYTAGEQPPDAEGWVKLNTNESPLPPSSLVAAAIRDAAGLLNRYPHPRGEPLRTALARHHGVDPAQVTVGNGADAVLEACFRAFCEPGSTVVTTAPTYSLLDSLTRLHSAQQHVVAMRPDGTIGAGFSDVAASMRVLVNPNSPTGTWIDPSALERTVAATDAVTVIDEAYCDFAPASCVPRLPAHPDWLVVRTFSKSYALAGLRVGYAVGAADLVADLDAVSDSYSLDRCASAGATAALADDVHHRELLDLVVGERHRVASELSARGWTVLPSHANFVCATPPGGGAASVADRLRHQRILVRHFDRPDTGDVLRVTVGAPAENDAFLGAL